MSRRSADESIVDRQAPGLDMRLLAVMFTFLAACSSSTNSGSTGIPAAPTGSTAPVTAAGADLPALVRQVEPSVVTVLTESGVGSGIVYKPDGTIVTNAHVVAGAQEVTVALADGQQVPATVRAADAASDIAVIQANRNGSARRDISETAAAGR